MSCHGLYCLQEFSFPDSKICFFPPYGVLVSPVLFPSLSFLIEGLMTRIFDKTLTQMKTKIIN